MMLSQITARLGRSQANQSGNAVESLFKPLKTKGKADEVFYAVKMIFNLMQGKIYFAEPRHYNDELIKRCHYFGNNAAASFQVYFVRETQSLYYLFGQVWNDCLLAFKQNNYSNCELYELIQKLVSNELISVGNKKGDGHINLSKLHLNQTNETIISFDNKGIVFKNNDNNEEHRNYERILHQYFQDENKKNRYVLVIPVIINNDNKEIIISEHEDYLRLICKIQRIEDNQLPKMQARESICYVCHNPSSSTSSEYSKYFSRTGINKIFTTTTINSASEINQNNYDKAYSICKSCYQDLRYGETLIEREFSASIAGEHAFILPDNLLSELPYEKCLRIEQGIDLAFNSQNADDWFNTVEAAVMRTEQEFWGLNIIVYRTDGNSVTVLQAIEDVPTIRLIQIMQLIQEKVERLGEHIHGMSLGSVYRLIPVRVNKRGEQIDIRRVLDLYKAVLLGEPVDIQTIFNYAVEALDKGLKQLSKNKIDNYYNLKLSNYSDGKEDFFIKKIMMGYLVLIAVVRQLKLIDQESGEGVDHVGMGSITNDTERFVEKAEEFLKKQGFSDRERALFYMGALLNRVAYIQFKNQHRSKPILKKVSFQGMSEHEVLCLYADLLEKLRQYPKEGITYFTEMLLKKFHEYHGALTLETKKLSERANVFYMMSGYAYMVGSKKPDVDDQEIQNEIKEEL